MSAEIVEALSTVPKLPFRPHDVVPLPVENLPYYLTFDRLGQISFELAMADLVDSWDDARKKRIAEMPVQVRSPYFPLTQMEGAPIIPIAAGQENQTLGRSIASYSGIDPNRLGVVLFANATYDPDMPGSERRGAEAIEKTLELIEHIHHANPDVPLLATSHLYAQPTPRLQAVEDIDDLPVTISTFRHDAWGWLGAMRLAAGGTKDFLAISQDADNDGTSRGYLTGILDAAQALPHIDIFTTRLLWANAGNHTAMVNGLRRYWQMWETAHRRATGRIPTAEATTAVRMSAAAAAQCFADLVHQEELGPLRGKIAALRGVGVDEVVHFIEDHYLRTDTRRALACMALFGRPPHHMWNAGGGTRFKIAGDEVRLMDTAHMVNSTPIDTATAQQIAHEIEVFYGHGIPPEKQQRLRDIGRWICGIDDRNPWELTSV